MTEINLNGKTKVCGIIGDPVEHSFSPKIHNLVYPLMGLNAAYVPFHVLPEGLAEAVKGAYRLGILGLNVTVPHKKEVMKYLCKTDEGAAKIGAVNTLKYTEAGYIGYNTDCIGVEYTFSKRGISLEGKTCLLLGAGGAADAICYTLLKEGAKKIYIANRTLSKAEALKAHLQTGFDTEIVTIPLTEAPSITDAEIVLNGTTVGFGDKIGLSPLPSDYFAKTDVKICFDAIYTPWETQLLKDAKASGVTAINGFDMLIYQAAAAAEIWFDIKFENDFLENVKTQLKENFIK